MDILEDPEYCEYLASFICSELHDKFYGNGGTFGAHPLYPDAPESDWIVHNAWFQLPYVCNHAVHMSNDPNIEPDNTPICNFDVREWVECPPVNYPCITQEDCDASFHEACAPGQIWGPDPRECEICSCHNPFEVLPGTPGGSANINDMPSALKPAIGSYTVDPDECVEDEDCRPGTVCIFGYCTGG